MALPPGEERAPADPGGAWRTGPERVPGEMSAFLEWFNRPPETDGVIRAATAHLWFAAVHPFEDGNGRIARAITDMALARSQQSPTRLYSVSHRILRERDAYCRALENTALETTGTCDITAWLSWFAGCLGRAMDDALEALSVAEQNAALRERAGSRPSTTGSSGRWSRAPDQVHPGRRGGRHGLHERHGADHAPGETPQENVNPHAGSHAAGDGEGRTEYRATGHYLPLTGQDREIAGRNGKIA